MTQEHKTLREEILEASDKILRERLLGDEMVGKVAQALWWREGSVPPFVRTRAGDTYTALTMIVRDEESIIARCLNSVLPYIDSYVIHDTGSKDRTKEICERILAGKPGIIRDCAWVDFGHNRQAALDEAISRSTEADWILNIDADEELVGTMPALPDVDALQVRSRGVGTDYWLMRMVRAYPGKWHYSGKTHEVLIAAEGFVPRIERLDGAYYADHYDSARRKSGRKFPEDIEMLEAQYKENPKDARAVFYLANSHFHAGHRERAIELHRERAALGGWAEEVYFSLFKIAEIRTDLTQDIQRCVEDFCLATAYRPHRFEALAVLMTNLRHRKLYATMYFCGYPIVAWSVLAKDKPKDILFLYEDAEMICLMEYATACYALGKLDEAKTLWTHILTLPNISPEDKENIQANLASCQ